MRVKAESVFEFEKQPRFLLAAFRMLAVRQSFLGDFYPLLNPAHWREVELRWLVGACKEFWEAYQKAPKLPTLRMRLDADADVKPEEKQLIMRVIDRLDDFALDDETIAYVQDNFESFIQYRATLYALHEAQELVDDGDLTGAVEAVQQSQLVQRYSDDWVTLPQDAGKFFEWFNPAKLDALTVPIGIEPLDAKLGGGARKGELAVIVAPLGFGKSQFLVHVGAHAFRLHNTVVHFSFENSKEETLARYMYNLLGIDSDILLKMAEDDPIYQKALADMDAMGGTFKAMRLVGALTTTVNLDGYLSRLEDQGIIPDVVIVDYGDLMAAARRSSNYAKKYEEMQTVFEELRDLAAKHNVIVWTASQANREGLKGRRVLTQHIADSLGKAFTADIIISMSKEQKEKEGHELRPQHGGDDNYDDEVEEPDNGKRILHLLKLRRGGSDNWWLSVKTRYSQATFLPDGDWQEPDEDALAESQKDTKRLPNKVAKKSRRKADADAAE